MKIQLLKSEALLLVDKLVYQEKVSLIYYFLKPLPPFDISI